VNLTHRAEAAIEIRAPAEEVFEWLVDRRKVSIRENRRVGWLPEDRASLGVGYRATEVIEVSGVLTWPNPGRRIEIAAEVTGYDPPLRFTYRVRQRGSETFHDSRLTPRGEGVVLTLESETRFGFLTSVQARLKSVEHRGERMRLDEMVARLAQEGLEGHLSALRTAIEGDGEMWPRAYGQRGEFPAT
jgi:hypothetical protein